MMNEKKTVRELSEKELEQVNGGFDIGGFFEKAWELTKKAGSLLKFIMREKK